MVKKISLASFLFFSACSVEQLDSAIKFVDKLNGIVSKGSKTPQEAPQPTPTPTPQPVETIVTLPPIQSPKCGERPASDGFKTGFTWKPNSETQRWAVAVLPPDVLASECTFAGIKARNKGEIGTPPRSVFILDGWTGERLEKTHGSIKVRCGCWFWSVKQPSKRTD